MPGFRRSPPCPVARLTWNVFGAPAPSARTSLITLHGPATSAGCAGLFHSPYKYIAMIFHFKDGLQISVTLDRWFVIRADRYQAFMLKGDSPFLWCFAICWRAAHFTSNTRLIGLCWWSIYPGSRTKFTNFRYSKKPNNGERR